MNPEERNPMESIAEDPISEKYLEERLAPTNVKDLIFSLFSGQSQGTLQSIKNKYNNEKPKGLEHLNNPDI